MKNNNENITRFQVIDKSTSIHEYTISVDKTDVNKTTYKLFYSDNDIWVDNGGLVLTIIDDGDDNFIFDKQYKTIDYGTTECIVILLNFIQKYNVSKTLTYNIIEEKILFTV